MQIRSNPDKRLVIWNKLQDLQSATTSHVGGQWVELGTTVYGDGQFGKCLSNDGTANSLTRTDKFTDTGFKLERGTIDLYAKWNAFTGGTYVIDLAIDTQTNFLLSVFMQADGKILFSVGKTGDSTSALSSVLSTGQFYKITCQWDISGIDGGSNILRIYIDSSLDGTSDTAIVIDNTPASEVFNIGSSRLNVSNIDGFIDNLKCYNYVNVDAITNVTEGIKNIGGTNIQLDKDKLLVHWYKLQSSGSAEIGINLPEVGTVIYSDGQFGKSYDNTATGDNYFKSISDWSRSIDLEKGCMEIWSKWAGFAGNNQFIISAVDGLTGSGGISENLIQLVSTSTDLIFQYKRDTVIPRLSISYDVSNLTAGVWHHIAGIWDSAGINGTSDIVRLYVDGVDVASSSGNPGSLPTAGFGFHFGISRSAGTPAQADGNSHRGNLDNAKIHNFAKTDFSDRFSEGISRINNFAFNPDKTMPLWNKLNDASGQSIIGEEATYNGSPSFVPCRYKQGPDIDAGTKYVDIPQVPGQKGTVELWFKPHFVSGANEVNHFIDNTIDARVRVTLQYRSDGELYFGIIYSTTGYLISTTSISFAVDDLIHVAGVWDTDGIDGGSDRTRLYVNNVLEASSTGAIATITQAAIRLGRNVLNNSTFCNSVIEDFKLSNYAITDFRDREQQELMDLSKSTIHYLKGSY